MSEIAIRVERLGKTYKIGRVRKPTDTLRDQIADWFTRRQESSFANGNPYGDTTLAALKDVTFEIQRGQVVGILGRNGAGKSTLLKILSRIIEPTTGAADIYGRTGSLLEVATGFHPELTGRENIFLNGAIMGMKRREVARKFDEIVAFAEIEKFIDTPVKRYSSGMYTRLAFAVAAHLESEILLVDEVLAVGDAAFQKKCLGKMGDVAREGRTILFVSHNMAAIQSLCTQGLVLHNGQNVLMDTAERAIDFYLRLGQDPRANNLKLRRDRKGSGRVRILSCKFVDETTGREMNTLLSAMPLRIEIEYEKNARDAVENFDISIRFTSQAGALMFACSSSARGQVPELNGATGRVYCHIPKFPLAAGVYTYNLYSSASGVLSDAIQDAGQVVVEGGDFYGTGKLPTGDQAGVLIEYEWN